MQREKHLEQFDILVVGGITGACIAHDAALRGFFQCLDEGRLFLPPYLHLLVVRYFHLMYTVSSI